MPVRLINTSTRLPADKRLEDELLAVMEPELKQALRCLYVPFWPSNAPIDVFLVNQLGRKNKNEEEDTDILGLYFSHHPKYFCPSIEVCPEKIMEHAKQACAKEIELARAYPALFCKIVIHELGHALMDNFRTRSREYEPWHFLASRFDEGDVDYFDHLIPPSGNMGQGCKRQNYFIRKNFSDTKDMRHVIEESLANAIAFKQNYGEEEKKFIEKVVSEQPPAYKAGLRWELPLSSLLNTARGWSAWKDSLLENSIQSARTTYDYSIPHSCDLCLMHRLENEERKTKETNVFSIECFEAEFKKHEKKRSSEMRSTIQ